MFRSGNKLKIIIPIIVAVFVALGLAFWFNRTVIFDIISTWSFHPSAEIASVENKLALTGSGKIIFEATAPALEDRENFNEHCKSHNQEVSVLGCYVGNHIYIYNIQSNDLTGIVESTSAHELLHAVWERMDNSEKGRISKLLNSVYNDDLYHDSLSDDLETYSEFDRIDELHSRIGTEITDLPEELEEHYAKYFTNQDLIVDYYNSYIEPFRELTREIESLSAELEKLDAEIESKTAEYYRLAEELSAKIDEFNKCADTMGCFITDTAFYAARNLLLLEQSQVSDLFDNLNNLIVDYNDIVVEYNENVLRGEMLEKTINSNSEIEKKVE